MTDFLIIGGGVAGLSAGAHLSELGTVTLLEAETALGYHASGRSAALYEANYGKPSTVALNEASKTYFETVDGGFLSPRGFMLLGKAGDDAPFEADQVEMKIAEISVDEAVAMVPILNRETVARAAFDPDCWDIDTDRLLQNYARTIRQNGGQVLTGQRVSAIARTGAGWEVTSGEQVHAAPMLFNAAGAWVDQVADMAGIVRLGFRPCRRSMARISAPGGLEVSGWPMIFGAGESWYAKPDAGKLIVSPSEEDPMDPMDAWADDMVLAEGIARYEEMVTEPVTRVESNWAGLRTFSPDRSLVLGPEPSDPKFFWVAGQGGYGFQSSPAAGRFVADQVGGRASELDAETQARLLPSRFR